GLLGAELLRRGELRVVDVAADDGRLAARLQHRDGDQAEAAAAQHRDRITLVELGQLVGSAVRGHGRTGEGRGERIVDAGRVEEVLGAGDQYVRGIGAGTVDAEKAASRNAVVVLAGLAHRALAAADPRVDELFLTDLHPA